MDRLRLVEVKCRSLAVARLLSDRQDFAERCQRGIENPSEHHKEAADVVITDV